MATEVKTNPAQDNGKPSKAAGPAPVVRLLNLEDDPRERMMKRQLPAFVISGVLHFVLIAALVILFPKEDANAENKFDEDRLVASVPDKDDDKKDEDPPPENLDNETLDPSNPLPMENSESMLQEEDKPVSNLPDMKDETVGGPLDNDMMVPSVPGVTDTADAISGVDNLSPDGNVAKGIQSGFGNMAAGGLYQGRSGNARNALLKAGGGNKESEDAVTRGLIWLAKKQNKSNGSWEYDGNRKDEMSAATGMALLPFLAAGQTQKEGKYKKVVADGMQFLINLQRPNGSFARNPSPQGMRGAPNAYGHAIATVAICECYGMTKDTRLREPATKALKYITDVQAPNGSWGYQANTEGDTSIVGWQIQALKAGKLAGLPVKDEAFKKATDFLDSVEASNSNNLGYGYRERGMRPSLSAVGLLSRYYMGWGPNNPKLQKGVNFLKTRLPSENAFTMYYYYYATQVMHFYGGKDWDELWNPRMRDMLIKMQAKNGEDSGSWKPNDGEHMDECGRLGSTCLSLLTLEVYYRHLPLYKRDQGGLKELERQ